MQRGRKIKWLGILLTIGVIWWQGKLCTNAGISENPYVSVSPDGEAYTIQAGETDTEWYKAGLQVETGMALQIPTVQKGEHLYDYTMDGMVPISKWMVAQRAGRCIHQVYPKEATYHGVNFGRKICRQPYFSGWCPICAICGQVVDYSLVYMSKEAAASMTYIDTTLAYYYKCPHCDNLEQGVERMAHTCKSISKNRYYVRYDANQGSGYMAKSIHMYDDATMYEGREVTPQTTLSLNAYYRMGYVFVGWNTKADGSGEFFGEGATIQNLAQEEGAEVILYAQWKVCRSVLEIDPAGGSFQGKSSVTEKEGLYGEVYVIPGEQLSPPAGYVVEFDTMGGKPIAKIQGAREWKEWKQEGSFYGYLQGNTYQFSDRDGTINRITAVYAECPVVLPMPEREGYSFGGWYLDKECTKRIGTGGDEFTPGKNTILYAGWVELQLNATDNYTANNKKGAVDLTWKQKDNTNKLYTIHQRKEGEEWVQIHSAQKDNVSYEAAVEILFSGEEEIYTIPYTGVYQLTLYGAQGGNYGAYSGGYGGCVEAELFLEKGDRLHCTIGGQDGYGGGGDSGQFAGGGGASTVYSEKLGLLFVAGGGGGACSHTDGLPGGTTGSVVEGVTGESGACGGGGGYQGGAAGEVLFHRHEDTCMHIHTGTPEQMGGCYTVPVSCGSTEFTVREAKRVFYYGNIEEMNGEWVHVFCVRCGSHDCIGHLDIQYEYICEKCGKKYTISMEKCTDICSYTTECEEAVFCGYEEGELVAVKAAFGGSNYINKEYCINYCESAGVRKGNGTLQITADIIGILEENEAGGIAATDDAAPERIRQESVSITGLSEKEIRVAFQKPKDYGTVYYHMVKSYDVKTNQLLCTSNITRNTLTTGVIGYYYLVDAYAETPVGKTHNYYAETAEAPFLIVDITAGVQYLHMAPMDRAGNLGPTTHVRISAEEIKHWPLLTEKIRIGQGENVKSASGADTYYVKADGVTPFLVECEGFIYGSANSKYQITHMSVRSSVVSTGTEGMFTVITPMQSSFGEGVTTYPMQLLQKKVEGAGGLADGGYTITKRYHYGKNLLWLQDFVLEKETDGQLLRLTPQAAVQTQEGFVYSDREQDEANSIYVIADAKGPGVWGLEQLEETQYLDFSKGEKMQVHLSAQDDGSGLAQFYVEIHNTDNGTTIRIEDEQLCGMISFEVSEENPVFNGEFQIMVFAQDAVGNETVEGVHLLGVGLQAYVERMIEPHDGAFKCGESGVLHIQTTGYVERVEVTFPVEMVEEGAATHFIYSYETPDYLQTEKLQFMIPLTVEDGIQTLQVKAYKSGTELENQPQFITIEVRGSILDEIRTRLR